MAWYRYVNALSLDVVAGAVICSYYFSEKMGVILPFKVSAILALSAWSIYTLDHLWDAHRSSYPVLTFRHQLHLKHFYGLLALVLAAMSTALIILPGLPQQTIIWGTALAIIVLVYFVISGTIKHMAYHKEIMIAIIYTGGILIGPLSISAQGISKAMATVVVIFTLIALVNLLIFAYYEWEQDTRQKFSSLVVTLGRQKARWLIVMLLLMALLLSLVSFIIWYPHPELRSSFLLLGVMTGLLTTVFSWPEFFGKFDRFRYFGDAAFIIPLVAI